MSKPGKEQLSKTIFDTKKMIDWTVLLVTTGTGAIVFPLIIDTIANKFNELFTEIPAAITGGVIGFLVGKGLITRDKNNPNVGSID